MTDTDWIGKICRLSYIKKSEICFEIWGKKTTEETRRLEYRLSNPQSWKDFELEKIKVLKVKISSDVSFL